MISFKKWYLLIFITLIGTLGTYPLYLPRSEKAMADVVIGLNEEEMSDWQIFQQTTLLASASPLSLPSVEAANESIKKVQVVITAYSSSIEETDEDPYITASGDWVRDGIVANNKYPFGTQVRFPEIYGDKFFVVEDRMNWRKGPYQFDIWMDSYEKALAFGTKIIEAEILTN